MKQLTRVIAEHCDKKVSIETNHNDLTIDEPMSMVETIIIGMGYSYNTWRDWVIEKADEYITEDTKIVLNKKL